MKHSAEAPRLPVAPFVITDIVLLLIAAVIGWQAPAPLDVASLAAISACVGLAAISGLAPFILNFNTAQEDALRDRADQIEALTLTITSTAEQVSIAAANLPATAATIAQQLDAAKSLPGLLQSQLQDAQSQLATIAGAENTALREETAALRRELASLREGESSRLTAVLAGVTRATADLAAFETIAKQHAEAIDRLPALTTDAVQQTTDAIAMAASAALARIESASADYRATLETVSAEQRAALAATGESTRTALAAALAAATESARVTLAAAAESARASLAADFENTLHSATRSALDSLAAFTPPPAPAAAPAPTPTPAVEAPVIPEPMQAPVPAPEPKAEPAPEPEVVAAPLPEPTPEPEAAAEPASTDAPEPAAADESQAEATPTNSESEAEPESESSQDEEPASSAPSEPALSSDGLTRLIATAYIGIGNKLFIRGDGPGLRTTKGAPLQFVSIGKWRWESPELLFPATIRLYKNDQVECTALGEITLEPGHHHEVNATF